MGVKITDTALRNTHQSLLAVQMHTPVRHSGPACRQAGGDHARTAALTVSAKESGVGRTAAIGEKTGRPSA